VPVSQQLLQYISGSLVFGKGISVSGQTAFQGFPLDKYPVAGKTGTAEVFGKQDTSWFASWAPAGHPKYLVVGMIEQAGLGSQGAAPMARKVYEGLFGIGHKPVYPGGHLPTSVPRVTPYGVASNPAPSTSTGATPPPGAPGTPTSPPSYVPPRLREPGTDDPTPGRLPTTPRSSTSGRAAGSRGGRNSMTGGRRRRRRLRGRGYGGDRR
jgi:penicillin-binding protein 2